MKTSRTAAIVLGAVALGGIGFVGCGSSDTAATTAAATAESGDAGQRLTAEEYVSAADKVCREGTADGLMPAADGLGILERGVWESYFCSVVALLTTAHSSQAITWVLPKHKTHPFTPPLAAPYYLYLA